MKTSRQVLHCLRVAAAAATLVAGAEAQQVQYSHGDPTALEQYMLELLNRARMNPAQEGVILDTINTWYSNDARARKPSFFANLRAEFAAFPAAQPLAFNSRLIQAARAHSQDMVTRNYLAHINTVGQTPTARAAAAGYDANVGENIDGGGASTAADVLHSHFSFLVDYDNLDTSNPLGHRYNAMTTSYTEAGIGIVGARFGGRLTQDFGAPARSYILGVAYTDSNANGAYDPGEGLAGITVRPASGNWFAVTSASGGFAIPVDPVETVSDTLNVPFPVQGNTWNAVQPYDVAYRQQQVAAAPNMTVNLTWSGGTLQSPVQTSVSIKRPVLRNYRIRGTDGWFYSMSMVTGQNAKADLIRTGSGGGTTPGGSNVQRDMDGDGRPDLVFQNASGQVIAWFMDNAGSINGWNWIYTQSLGDWRIVAHLDVNADNRPDVLLQNNAGQIVAWLMDGAGSITGLQWIYSTSLGDWKIAATFDVDADGREELLLQNNAGNIFAWTLSTTGAITGGRWIYDQSLGDWKITAAFDVNGDNRRDLVLQNTAGQVYAWYVSTAGSVTGGTWIYNLATGDWRIVTTLDANADSRQDLILQNNAGQVIAWHVNSSGSITGWKWLYNQATGGFRIR